MEALRFRAKPVNRRIMIELPADVDNGPVEVIVLGVKRTSSNKVTCRQPPMALSAAVI